MRFPSPSYISYLSGKITVLGGHSLAEYRGEMRVNGRGARRKSNWQKPLFSLDPIGQNLYNNTIT